MISPYMQSLARNHAEPVEGDFFASDPRAVPPLVRVEPLGAHVWECCCGSGDMARALQEAGVGAAPSDAHDRGFGMVRDVFTVAEPLAPVIVTNPPYADAFPVRLVRHAREIGVRKVCLLLPMAWWDAQRRVDFLTEEAPPARVWAIAGRIRMARNGDWNATGNSPNRSYAWWVWDFTAPPAPTIVRPITLEA